MRHAITILSFIFLTVGLFLPTPTFAVTSIPEDKCYCYCTDEDGIEARDFVKDESACRTGCDADDQRYYQCFEPGQEDYLPEKSNLCWTEEDCTSEMVTTDSGEVPSDWGGQTSNCIAGKGYCYNPPGTVNPYTGNSATATLGVQIGSLERPTDLVEYIKTVYNFMLPVGGLLAVLMFMIAGLQWMTARGNASAVSAAKERMGTAAFGLVLLFSAYAIAMLIDPSLVSFDIFRAPKVQTVIFLEGGGTCTALAANDGITVNPSEGVCGEEGTVMSIDEDAVGGSVIGVAEGDTCSFSACESLFGKILEHERCASLGSGEYECIRCNEVNSDIFGGTSLSPGERLCGSLVIEDAAAEADGLKHYCEYVSTDYFDGFSDTCAEIMYPKHENSLNCILLANDYGANCRAYDFVYSLIDGDKNQVDDIEGEDGVFPLLEALCSEGENSDPCEFAPPGESCEISSYDDGLVMDEAWANCANTSSHMGFSDCLNSEGEEDDDGCYGIKDGFSPDELSQALDFLIDVAGFSTFF
jgi:hypothetical protein